MSAVIDSRDLQAELDDLTPEVENWTEIVNDGQEEERRDEYPGLSVISRHGELSQLADELSGAGWEYGIQFIAETYFEDYARELADEIGAFDATAGWPSRHIDWEAAAEELKQDYHLIEFEGETYYYREA